METTIIHKITENDQEEFNKLEKTYYEMIGLQHLLLTGIMSKLISEQEYYYEQYIDKYTIFEKQKQYFQDKILKPIYIDNFYWEADFFAKEIKVVKNDK